MLVFLVLQLNVFTSSPCNLCLRTGTRCQVVNSVRQTTCLNCKKKKKCSIKGVVNLVATGKIGTAEETGSIKILDQEGVKAAGLGRGTEMIMSQIISFQEEVMERLGAIEVRLKKMEKG